MDPQQKRMLLFLAIVFPMVLLQFSWQDAQNRKRIAARKKAEAEAAAIAAANAPPAPPAGEMLPGPAPDGAAPVPTPAPLDRPAEPERKVVVRTKSYEVEISSAGAVPVRWDITDEKYLVPKASRPSPEDDGRVRLIDPNLESFGREHGTDRPFETILREQQARFYNEFNRDNFSIEESREGDATIVRCESRPSETGLRMVKTWRFPDEGFGASLSIALVNGGTSRLMFNNEGQGLGLSIGPGMGPPPPPIKGLAYGIRNVATPFVRTGSKVADYHPSPKDDEPIVLSDGKGAHDWAGFHNQYFLFSVEPRAVSGGASTFSAIRTEIPRELGALALVARDQLADYARLEAFGPAFELQPGQTVALEYSIFAGPKDRKVLNAEGLGGILFNTSWRWFRGLCLFLMTMLGLFHSGIGNWGLAILALVVALRIVTFPLAYVGMKHTAKMGAEQRRLKPHLDRIKEKHKDDPQKLQQETWKLYQEHGVNPFGMFKGCFWMMIQIPIFIALYRILIQDIDLRGASFLWVDDLSREDALIPFGGFALPLLGWTAFNLFPFLTAITQFYSTKVSMSSTPGAEDNPMQKQMMYMMPAVMLLTTYPLPAGLFIYWTSTNLWQLVQQKFVNKRVMAQYAELPPVAPPPPARKGGR